MFKIRIDAGIICTYQNVNLWYEVKEGKATIYTANWCRLGELAINGKIDEQELNELLDKRINRMTKEVLEKEFYDLYEALKLDQQIIDCLGREDN